MRSNSDPLADRPVPLDLKSYRPTNAMGGLHFGLAVLLTTIALACSLHPSVGWWLLGQLLLSQALLMWFAILHEAGHKTLFRSSRYNFLVGSVAGLFALIPFRIWRLVHARHHYWTGWKDLDPTTSTTLPRPMSSAERWLINACWALSIPLFSLVYRIQNYWWLPRLRKQFSRTDQRRILLLSLSAYLVLYSAVILLIGPKRCLILFGLGTYLSFVLQDILILSQHSHIPMQHTEEKDVTAFPPVEQQVFTRSLLFPSWYSRFVLLNLDAHELHHMAPAVPGYFLQRITYRPINAVSWWSWIRAAKRVRGDVLIFQNRNDTGWDL